MITDIMRVMFLDTTSPEAVYMTRADAIVGNAKLVIIIWIVLLALSIPMASRVDQVLVSEESGFLPETAESVKVQRLISSSGGQGAPDVLLVVDNVPVSPETYNKTRQEWSQLGWSAGRRVSWVDVTLQAHEGIKRGMEKALNQTLAALEGYVSLWEALVNTTENLRRLEQTINSTSQALVSADMVLSKYNQVLGSLVNTRDKALGAAQGVLGLCQQAPDVYTELITAGVTLEALLETQTQAYQRGSLTQEDLQALQVLADANPLLRKLLKPEMVQAVFQYTMGIGGPSNFGNAHAALLAVQLARLTINDTQTITFLYILANQTAPILRNLPDLRTTVALEGPDAVRAAVQPIVEKTAQAAIVEYARAVSREAGNPLIAYIAEALAERGCRGGEDSIQQVLRQALTRLLVDQGVPSSAAPMLVDMALSGDTSIEKLAFLALDTTYEQALAQGAPEDLARILKSPQAAQILLKHDPRAMGVLSENPDTARAAAVELLSKTAGAKGLDPHLLRLVASLGPEKAALTLVEENAPPQAREFLGLLREKGIPQTRGELLKMASGSLVEQISRMGGLDRDTAERIAEAALRVFNGMGSLEAEVESLAWEKLVETWPSIIGELNGTLVALDGRAFIVMLYNVDYQGAIRDRDALAAMLKQWFPHSRVLATGDVVSREEMRTTSLEDVRRSDRYSMVLVLVVLAIVLQSVAALFLPFIGIGMGLSLALALAYLLASGELITLTTIARTVMFSTGLGLGIDYATLVSRRFREELPSSSTPVQAAARALRRSTRPVVAGAATASIGFGSLALAWDFPFLKSIGTSVPLAIAMVTLSSLTLIPALLALLGGSRRLWWPFDPRRARGVDASETGSLGRLVEKAAPLLIVIVIVALIPAIVVHLGFEGSHDLTLMLPEGTESLEAMNVIIERFDPGVMYPLTIVVSGNETATRIVEALSGLECVSQARVASTLEDGRVLVQAVLSVDPLARQGIECARQVRGMVKSIDEKGMVGGAPAVSLDLEEMLNARFYNRVLPAAVVLMFLSMLLAYGGVAVALSAVLAVVIAAELAIAAAVYYYTSVQGMEVPWFLPLTVFTAILGVGMDYNSFSISRAAEEYRRAPGRGAVARAVSRSAFLVMGLSLIMASAYGGLMLSSIPNMRMMGLALSLGVLFAGVLASMVLIPSIITLLGRKAWWPWGPKAEE